MPTLGEFISRSRKYGFTLRRVGFDIHGPRGVTHLTIWGEMTPRHTHRYQTTRTTSASQEMRCEAYAPSSASLWRILD